jgi:hypothetical protein
MLARKSLCVAGYSVAVASLNGVAGAAWTEYTGRVKLEESMNLTIELPDEKAAALEAQAAANGLTVKRWVEQIAVQHAGTPSASIAHLQKIDPKEWARRFHEWAESHDRTTPLLSDEAIGREAIYPDRI